jgi:hypothetical protein
MLWPRGTPVLAREIAGESIEPAGAEPRLIITQAMQAAFPQPSCRRTPLSPSGVLLLLGNASGYLQGATVRSAERASILVLYGVPPATRTTVFPLGFFGRTEHLRVFVFWTT